VAKLRLNKKIIGIAAQHIRAGTPQKYVASIIGVSEHTWYAWLKAGENKKRKIFVQFYQAIEKAKAEAISRNVMLINQAAQNGTWQAAAWWLERRYPQEFGKRGDYTLRHEGDLQIKIIPPEDDDDD